MTLLLLLGACLLTCLGQIAQKLTIERWEGYFPGVAQAFTNAWLWLALGCLGGGMLLWLLVLQRLDVGVAYPMLALNFVLITLTGRYMFKEPVDGRHWLGLAMILIGVILLGGPGMNGSLSSRRGLTLAMGSVVLVSAAQLGMRWSMVRLPQPSQWQAALQSGNVDPEALAVVISAVAAYGLSMLCWLAALRDLPLSRAYSLLSISYALVYLLAALLPFFHETLTAPRTVGVTLIVLGVMTINMRRGSVSVDNSGKELSR